MECYKTEKKKENMLMLGRTMTLWPGFFCHNRGIPEIACPGAWHIVFLELIGIKQELDAENRITICRKKGCYIMAGFSM